MKLHKKDIYEDCWWGNGCGLNTYEKCIWPLQSLKPAVEVNNPLDALILKETGKMYTETSIDMTVHLRFAAHLTIRISAG